MSTELFTVTYKPTCLQEFVGNASVVAHLEQWLNAPDHPCAIVHGLCGIGKTTLVDLVLAKHGCRKVELDAPSKVTPVTLFGEKNVVVVDNGTATAKEVVDFVQKSAVPLVFIADNIYDPALKPLLSHSVEIKMVKPTYAEVYPLLYRVVTSEKVRIKEPDLRALFDQAHGDVRFILNTLHAMSAKPKTKEVLPAMAREKDIQSTSVFDTTSFLLSMDEPLDAKFDMYERNDDLHPLMIQENYPNHILSSRDPLKWLDTMACAAQSLSDMDAIQTTMVAGGGWELTPYVAVHALATASRCNKKGALSFPRHFSKMTAKKGALLKEPKPNAVKEPKPKAVKEPKPKAVKEPKPKAVKEPKPKAVKEPKPKAVKEPKPNAVKEPKPKAVKEPKPKMAKELKSMKEPKPRKKKEPESEKATLN